MKRHECHLCSNPISLGQHYSDALGHEFHFKCYLAYKQAGGKSLVALRYLDLVE